MDINVLSQMIGSVGFPIAACCVMFWQNFKLQDTLKDIAVTMQKMSDELSDLDRERNND